MKPLSAKFRILSSSQGLTFYRHYANHVFAELDSHPFAIGQFQPSSADSLWHRQCESRLLEYQDSMVRTNNTTSKRFLPTSGRRVSRRRCTLCSMYTLA